MPQNRWRNTGQLKNQLQKFRLLPLHNIYYGWIIVGIIFLSSFASAVQLNPTLSVFIKPITNEFDWNRSDLAGAVTIGTIIGGIVASFVGPILDRFGPRWILSFSFLFLGTLVILLGQVEALWHFYIITICTRVLIQGFINITCQTVVARWFLKLRGRAMAMANMGQRFGTGVIPYFTQSIVINQDWRSAARSIGILTWILTLIPTTMWLKRKPQDMGLLPDGKLLNNTDLDEENNINNYEISYTLKDALKNRTFFILGGIATIASFVATGVNFNMIPYLTDIGMPADQAVAILLIWSLSGIPGLLIVGFLAERFSNKLILFGCYSLITFGVMLLTSIDTFADGIIFAILHGGSFGTSLLLQNLILANYYGPDSLGTLRGAIIPFQMTGNSIGPLVATIIYDTQGSYSQAMNLYIFLLFLILVAILFIRVPLRKRISQ